MDFLVHHALEITVVETWDSNAYSERLKPFMFKKKTRNHGGRGLFCLITI